MTEVIKHGHFLIIHGRTLRIRANTDLSIVVSIVVSNVVSKVVSIVVRKFTSIVVNIAVSRRRTS